MGDLVIHKQRLPIFAAQTDVITINAPAGAKVLKIARQFSHEQSPYVWYACDPNAPLEPLPIFVAGTGGEIPADILGGYLGTEVFHDGQLVFHFFRAALKSAGGRDDG